MSSWNRSRLQNEQFPGNLEDSCSSFILSSKEIRRRSRSRSKSRQPRAEQEDSDANDSSLLGDTVHLSEPVRGEEIRQLGFVAARPMLPLTRTTIKERRAHIVQTVESVAEGGSQVTQEDLEDRIDCLEDLRDGGVVPATRFRLTQKDCSTSKKLMAALVHRAAAAKPSVKDEMNSRDLIDIQRTANHIERYLQNERAKAVKEKEAALTGGKTRGRPNKSREVSHIGLNDSVTLTKNAKARSKSREPVNPDKYHNHSFRKPAGSSILKNSRTTVDAYSSQSAVDSPSSSQIVPVNAAGSRNSQKTVSADVRPIKNTEKETVAAAKAPVIANSHNFDDDWDAPVCPGKKTTREDTVATKETSIASDTSSDSGASQDSYWDFFDQPLKVPAAAVAPKKSCDSGGKGEDSSAGASQTSTHSDEMPVSGKRGRPSKAVAAKRIQKSTNADEMSVPVKRNRPVRAVVAKLAEQTYAVDMPAARGRGRPRGSGREAKTAGSRGNTQGTSQVNDGEPIAKGRGRPRGSGRGAKVAGSRADSQVHVAAVIAPLPTTSGRGRGRPARL